MKETKNAGENYMMGNKQVVSRVLDYWYAIEFLGQDSYDVCTEESKLARELKQFEKAGQFMKDRRRQISIFELINSEHDIYSQIVNRAQKCGMTIWGNLTFYIGRICRQTCIEKLAQGLGIKLEQVENSSEYIPILSFQCTMHGTYVEHTLSLSTIIWAISQMEGKTKGNLSDTLSSEEYADTIEMLEEKFFGSDDKSERNTFEEAGTMLNLKEMPFFDDNAIAISKVMSIHSEIVRMYGKLFAENAIEEKMELNINCSRTQRPKINMTTIIILD